MGGTSGTASSVGGASGGASGANGGACSMNFSPRAPVVELVVDRSSTMFENPYWAPVRTSVLDGHRCVAGSDSVRLLGVHADQLRLSVPEPRMRRAGARR
jgi:hypothetical protein